MSYHAIKDVTHTIRLLLRRQLLFENDDPALTLLPPGNALPDTFGANIYLYRVLESSFTKNQDWRGDRETPPSSRPALGLQLFYLITPLTVAVDNENPDAGEDAHLILGALMLLLHENPILNHVHLPSVSLEGGRTVPVFDADLHLPAYIRNSYEQVKLTLLPTSVEEVSKIWATMNQPYRLSVAYEVSLVELTPTPPSPPGSGIVLSTGVKVITLDPPRLNSLTPSGGALARMLAGGTLQANDIEIAGFGLSFPGQSPVVRVGGKPVTIKSVPQPTDQTLTVTLPTDLNAGPQVDVQITLNGRTSTLLTFLVSPWITSTKPLRTALDPKQGDADLKLEFTGTGFGIPPRAIRFYGPESVPDVVTFEPGGTDGNVKITLPTITKNGLYEIRLIKVDDTVSNKRTLEILPFVKEVNVQVVQVEGKDVHQLTVEGTRLKASDVRLVLDEISYVAPKNDSLTQIIYPLRRLLTAGQHRLAVSVDGHRSRSIDFEVK